MAFENGAAAGAAVGTAAIPIPGVGTAIGGVLGGLLGGGVDKNAIRDQQEAAEYQKAVAGNVTAAQGIYDRSQGIGSPTHERIVKDTGYWQQLSQSGWTVSGGKVAPPGVSPNAQGGGNKTSNGVLAGIAGQLGFGTGGGGAAAGQGQPADMTPLIIGGLVVTGLIVGVVALSRRGKK